MQKVQSRQYIENGNSEVGFRTVKSGILQGSQLNEIINSFERNKTSSKSKNSGQNNSLDNKA